jgi:hypothetical protein
LRSIIDRFDSNQRENIIKEYFKDYLPEALFNLLTSEFNEKLGECPLELNESNNKEFISSIYNKIILEIPNFKNINEDSLKIIK